MNIFATDPSARVSALALDDRRLVKMTLETAQLLSTVLHSLGIAFPGQYRATHQGHPCTRWAVQSASNFGWLCEHGYWLGQEYTRRFGKTHKSAKVIAWAGQAVTLATFPQQARTPFANCTPYKSMEVHEAYRRYMRAKWAADGALARWTKGQAPQWINNGGTDNGNG